MKKTSNKIEIKVCSLYSKGFSHNSISQALRISKPTIWRILKRNKITTIRTTGPHPDNKIKVNEDFFKNIDNEKSAYWLGFLYADGCVSKQQSGSLCLSLGLAQKDVNHLRLFLKDLKSNHSLYYYKTRDKSSVKIIRKKICDDLIRNGCIINKTKRLTIPSISHKLVNHFIRGFFDGDGYVGQRRSGLCFTITSASKKFLEALECVLRKELGLSPKKIYEVKNSNAYRLSYEGNQSIHKIYEFMYKNGKTYLKRKRKIFDLFFIS